jgi:spermidine/putrescine transport system ATP-binding protein
MGTSNLMTGVYRSGAVQISGGPAITVGTCPEIADGAEVSVSIRPEKIWLSDFEADMPRARGVIKDTVYSGPTTTYLIELAPGVIVAALEQNTARSRNEDRWAGGESVEIAWKTEHCLVLA